MVEETELIVEEIVDNDPVPDELQDGEVVIEVGAYEGAWVKKVCETHPHCQVSAFEPATRAYNVAIDELEGYPNVALYPVALGKQTGTATLCDRNRDGANTFDHNPEDEPSETVNVIDVADFVRPLDEVGLMHLNAEGDEVTILERLIERWLLGQFKMILVQWHPYDDEMRDRIVAIEQCLWNTHHYEPRGPWGCWIRRGNDA